MNSDGSERMTEIVTTLAVVGEVLAQLVVKLASATAAELPALLDDAEELGAPCCRLLHRYRTGRPPPARGSYGVACRVI